MSRACCIGECMVELRGAGDGLLRQGFAGDSYNTAVYLKRSAPEVSVQYVTATGTDPMSRTMRAAWSAEGVEDDLAFAVAGRKPGLYMIELDAAGERRFHYWRGESAAKLWLRELKTAGIGKLFGADLVYLSGISLAILAPDERREALSLLEALRGKVGRIAFDPNYRPALWRSREEAAEIVQEAAVRSDIFLPSSEDMEALDISPDCAETAMTAEGARCSVNGAWVQGALASRVVDTSGAGDSFNGAYLAARLRGAEPAEAARAGLALAAEVVGHPGAVMPR
ncbi:MAG TPA: sugar kinase [Magnetospirillaceae bacterium]|nr:sugar kinase [Magnetospirillaceae bacterium]